MSMNLMDIQELFGVNIDVIMRTSFRWSGKTVELQVLFQSCQNKKEEKEPANSSNSRRYSVDSASVYHQASGYPLSPSCPSHQGLRRYNLSIESVRLLSFNTYSETPAPQLPFGINLPWRTASANLVS
ncbi:hypothetical protein PoB_007527500 [Plakobranchus ocellatus]|uniref:Uncharacterized protein n=1 Tax=Plakobranchus ocellatus TaxID=259542 RepID=A0AAV4DXM5_9GAST|nr:hypothetical protein PoB_007527500 [Plakobranchus ocellatus]